MGSTRVSSTLFDLKSHHASTTLEVDNGNLTQLYFDDTVLQDSFAELSCGIAFSPSSHWFIPKVIPTPSHAKTYKDVFWYGDTCTFLR